MEDPLVRLVADMSNTKLVEALNEYILSHIIRDKKMIIQGENTCPSYTINCMRKSENKQNHSIFILVNAYRGT